ncbi:golgin subfamily A member 4 isoform 2-T2 [Odontesthes bonariensis]|uniref:golgin subfamily A member 4 isoform X2 n=1 Tax=Odontesthes bonariensis TaxID=219752 RepID=UPI003F58990F
MFKKLKQKINEEQSPQRNAQSPQQAQMGSGDRRSSQTPPFHHDGTPSSSDREMLAGMIAEPAFLSEYTIFALDHSNQPKTAQVASVNAPKGPARSPRGSINGDGSASPHREELQSFAQKLQLKVPSMESLIRGGASRAESLFRSPSKENLVRSPSRESLTPLGENESPGAPMYDPPSDIESEAEEPSGSAESLPKEQLLHRLLQVERSLGKYRGKYSELVTAYRTVQREKEKTQVILSQSQDKALRRIGELREELQMDQQAKKHLQDEFDAALEEKDQMITVLQTQVGLLKKRAKGVSGSLPPEGEVPQSVPEDSTSAAQSPSKVQGLELEVPDGEGNSDPTKHLEALQKRVKRQENLLQKCKDMMRTHKDRSTQLTSENETLQEQLQERLQELEKMKELHTTEKTKLITQLRDAKNLIEQLEQDKGMVIAETKRQMHETLEMKEEEIAQLRSRFQLAAAQKEKLQEQKEKAEKSAFEELERALGVAQKAEEARKQLQVQLEEQVREVERASEEERKSLQQELTRVKQEVVTIMKKSSEESVARLEKVHSEALAAKEEEMKDGIREAAEHCKREFEQLSKEREQQASLALEDAELQKTAIRTEADNKVKEIQLELETARTRILELESSVDKVSQDESGLSREFSSQLDELKNKHKEQITALEEKHREQLEKHNDALTQQHNAVLEEKHRVEMETLLRDKELQFQAHVEDMNQKTLEKLDAKQTELEALSVELSEVLKSKQLLEEKLIAAEDASELAQQEHVKRFQDQVSKHKDELANIKHKHEQSLGGIEKTLKEELNAMKIVLREKEKELEQLILKEKTLQEESHSTAQKLEVRNKEFEELQQSLAQAQLENGGLKESNVQLDKISDDLGQCKRDLRDLEHQLQLAKNDCQQKEKSLQELEHQLQETKKELVEKEKSYSAELNTNLEEQRRLKKQLEGETAAHEMKLKNTKTEMEAKLKTQETKMEKFKQKAKDMHENFKKKLQQNEENMKKELAKKESELQQKEQQVQEKIVEMAQKSSQGLSSTVSELQANHKEELKKLHSNHKHEIEGLVHRWEEKLAQQEEELVEKHSLVLQEKGQELEEISQQLGRSRAENEHVLYELKDLKEGLSIRETTVQKLQEELNEAAVKLESLSQAEALLKEKMESAERNLNQALSERNALQDELTTAGEENRERVKTLSDKLSETELQLKALESSRSKEAGDLQSRFEETSIQLQAKEVEFQQQLIVIISKTDYYCKEVQSKVESASNELQQRVEGRVKELNDRLLCSQEKVGHLRNCVLAKAGNICTLEDNLRQYTEENKNLCISLEQTTAQVNAHKEHIEALTHEREGHTRSIGEQMRKIEELSEANRVISENLKTNQVHITDLESIVTDLKNQLASSIKEKEEAINQLIEQYEEQRQRAAAQMKETIEGLEKERKSASEQADVLRNSLSENENKAETKFTQDDNTIKCLQTRLNELEREIAEKNEALQRLAASIDNQSISKSELDQVLSEKEQKVNSLTVELESCISRLGELQERLALKTKECEQLTSDLKQQHGIRENEKRELVEQLQQIRTQCAQNGNLEQEMVEKLQSLEEDNQKCKHTLESQREEFERMKGEIIKGKEESLKATEERLSAESARKVSELKKKAEQKISQIKKQLTTQLEEKEQTVKALQRSLEGMKTNETSGTKQIETLEDKTKTLEEALVKLKEEQERQIDQILSNERLEKEKSLEELKNMYEDKLSSLPRDNDQQVELREAVSALREIQAKLNEAEEENGKLVAEINNLKEEVCKKEAQLDQHQVQTASEAEVKVERSSIQQTTSAMENHSPMQEVDGDESLQSLKYKLSQMKNDKEKIQKDFTRLQKDMRSLRKEHEQDLQCIKRELLAENEKKFKLELEDLEMKHNSAMKQLLREFNTQMALKERELDTAVKETIAKAQAVEAELIGSHHDEASQLRKNREEEMGDRVWQVQKQLEELQTRSQDSTECAEMTPEDLKAQLAEKTTLLSDARLKEQEFVEKIHSLEDKIKFLHHSTVVTHLGSTFKDPEINTPDAFSEPTETEYLRKVLFEYMMGRETKTMAKVITSILKFPPDQAQKVLDKEDSKTVPWLR